MFLDRWQVDVLTLRDVTPFKCNQHPMHHMKSTIQYLSQYDINPVKSTHSGDESDSIVTSSLVGTETKSSQSKSMHN